MGDEWINKQQVGFLLGFPGGSTVKNPPANTGETGSIAGLEDALEKAMALQYSCLGNPMDRRAWRTIVHRVAKESDTTEGLNNNRTHFNTKLKGKQPGKGICHPE